jgi:hypothetical protein
MGALCFIQWMCIVSVALAAIYTLINWKRDDITDDCRGNGA